MNLHLHHLLYKLKIQKKEERRRKIMIEEIIMSIKVSLNIIISIIRDTKGSVALLNHHTKLQY